MNPPSKVKQHNSHRNFIIRVVFSEKSVTNGRSISSISGGGSISSISSISGDSIRGSVGGGQGGDRGSDDRLNEWLLDDLLDNWLLDVLDWLLDDLLDNWLLDDWLLDNLSFNSLVFDSFLNSFDWDVFSGSFVVNLRNVLNLVFNGVVVSDSLFSGNVFDSFDWFVFEIGSFVGDLFDSSFSLDGGLNDLLDNWLLDVLDWLLNNWLSVNGGRGDGLVNGLGDGSSISGGI